MRFLSSSPRTAGEGGKGWRRKESAPAVSSSSSSSSSSAWSTPKPQSRSVDQGTLDLRHSPSRSSPSPLPIPSIELSTDETPSSLSSSSSDAAGTIRAASPRPPGPASDLAPDVSPWRRRPPPSWPPDDREPSVFDVPSRLDHRRSRRPNIQVRIPEPQTSSSLAYNPHRLAPDLPWHDQQARPRSSSSPRPPTDMMAEGPFSPRSLSARPAYPPAPFTSPPEARTAPVARGLGLEPTTGSQTEWPTASASSISLSSDGTVDEDRSSVTSRRTSRSSVAAEYVPIPRGSPTSTVPAPEPSLQQQQQQPAGAKGPSSANLRAPTRLRAALSRRDLAEKPLPPEPTEMAPAPLAVAGRPVPLASGRPSRPRAVSRSASLQTVPSAPLKSPVTPGSAPSLKSKYSSSDLDSIDQAFRRSSPKHEPPPSAALREAEQALEAHLSTINEADPFRWDHLPGMTTPLQISRGPMEMTPSRPPPAPPATAKGRVEAGRLTPKKKMNAPAPVALAGQMTSPRKVESPKDRGPRWAGRGLRLRAHDKPARPPLAVVESGMRPEESSARTVPASVHNDPAVVPGSVEPDLGVTDPDGLSIMTMVEALNGCSTSDRSVYLTSPYASSTALPLSPISASPVLPMNISEDERVLDGPSKAEAYEEKPSERGSDEDERPKEDEEPSAEKRRRPPPTESVLRAPLVRFSKREDRSVDEQVHDGVGDRSVQRRGRRTSVVNSIVSLAVSEIPDWYLEMPSSIDYAQGRQATAAATMEHNITARSAEAIILNVLENLDDLQDLFSTAVVSRGFYRTFKKHEQALTKATLKKMSAAAWELREIAAPPTQDASAVDVAQPATMVYTPAMYLRDHKRDMYTLVALKSLILERCRSFLRPITISALAGEDNERSLALDDAFWRVWTFCKIFGDGQHSSNDRERQMSWLRGGHPRGTVMAVGAKDASSRSTESFGRGNGGGLTSEQLYDMLEVWTCLGVLVRGFHGKTKLARDFGIYDHVNVAEGDVGQEESLLEEWVWYLLTLGPSVILDLATPSDQAGSNGFVIAAENGWTSWSLPAEGMSRSTFLKEAVTRVYQERHRSSSESCSRSASAASSTASAALASASAAVVDKPQVQSVQQKAEGPQSVFADKQPKTVVQPVENVMDSCPGVSAVEDHLPAAFPKQPRQQVVDPVDRAIWQLVGMGFPVANARRALAQTDTGTNLNVGAAIELCLRWAEEMRSPLLDESMNSSSSPSGAHHHTHGPSYDNPNTSMNNHVRLVVAG